MKLDQTTHLEYSSKRYAGVIFDFNGVLLWDSSIQEQAWKKFSTSFRGKSLSNKEMYHMVHGRNNDFILNYLNNGIPLDQEKIKELTDKKEAIYRHLCLSMKSSFRLSPGSEDFLDFCKKNKIPCAIATASQKVNLDFFIKHLQLDRWFDYSVIVYDDGSFPGKPAPDIYLLASHKLNLEPSDCIVIEDSISGLKSAFNAGIGKIYAMNSTLSDSELEKFDEVNTIISQINEIPKDLLYKS